MRRIEVGAGKKIKRALYGVFAVNFELFSGRAWGRPDCRLSSLEIPVPRVTGRNSHRQPWPAGPPGRLADGSGAADVPGIIDVLKKD